MHLAIASIQLNSGVNCHVISYKVDLCTVDRFENHLSRDDHRQSFLYDDYLLKTHLIYICIVSV